jgi:hypothetical protein
MIDAIPTMALSSLPDGFTEFVNLRWLDFTGLSLDQALGCGCNAAFGYENYNNDHCPEQHPRTCQRDSVAVLQLPWETRKSNLTISVGPVICARPRKPRFQWPSAIEWSLLQVQTEQLRRQKLRGELPADVDERMLLIASIAMRIFPLALPQFTRLISGLESTEPRFVLKWCKFLRWLGERIVRHQLPAAGRATEPGANPVRSKVKPHVQSLLQSRAKVAAD